MSLLCYPFLNQLRNGMRVELGSTNEALTGKLLFAAGKDLRGQWEATAAVGSCLRVGLGW